MIRRGCVILTVLLIWSVTLSAQSADQKTKMFDYYAGVQVNQLLKQILNLSNSSDDINNPYLFTFSLNSAKSGWGAHAGFGYDYQKVSDDLTQSDHVSTINDLFYRIGGGRRLMIGKKFQLGYGLDFIGTYLDDNTTTVSVNPGIDSTISKTSSQTTGFGFGPQASLGFMITERLIISTEVSFYFLQSTEKTNTFVTRYELFNNPPTVSTSNHNSKVKTSDITFNLPVAIFLVLKF
jgi:hypothetical protein